MYSEIRSTYENTPKESYQKHLVIIVSCMHNIILCWHPTDIL